MKNLRMKLLIPIFLLMTLWENDSAQESKTAWNYPVKPGSEEWLSKSDFIDRLSLLNIPEEVINSIGTERLLDLCLEYPYFGLVFTRPSVQQGYEFIRNNFNGFRELEKRPDAGDFLLKKYEKMNPSDVSYQTTSLESGQFMAKFTFIELLLAQDLVLLNLKDDSKNRILKMTFEKFQQKANEKKYGIEGLTTTAFILAKIVNNNADKDLKINLMDKSAIAEFSKTCIITDPELFNLILKSSAKYLE